MNTVFIEMQARETMKDALNQYIRNEETKQAKRMQQGYQQLLINKMMPERTERRTADKH